jgi:hypothetical protein
LPPPCDEGTVINTLVGRSSNIIMSAWTAERTIKFLLLIIQRQVTTPDYNYLAAELGSTYESVRYRWGIIRREFGIPVKGGIPPVSLQKKKPKATDDVKMEDRPDFVEVERELNVVFQDPTPPVSPQKKKSKATDDVKMEAKPDIVKAEREINVVSEDPTPPATPNKRKAEHIKENAMDERVVKKARTAGSAAMKAVKKIAEEYENPWEGYIE